MKTIIDFISAQLARVVTHVDGVCNSAFHLASAFASAAIRVLLVVALYKIVFQDFLQGIIAAF